MDTNHKDTTETTNRGGAQITPPHKVRRIISWAYLGYTAAGLVFFALVWLVGEVFWNLRIDIPESIIVLLLFVLGTSPLFLAVGFVLLKKRYMPRKVIRSALALNVLLVAGLVLFVVNTLNNVPAIIKLNTPAARAAVTSDLTNLKANTPFAAKAYDLVQIEDAWDEIDRAIGEGLLPPGVPGRATVGIIDTGLDAAHPEFAGTVFGNTRFGRVDLGKTPISAKTDTDPDGHGTLVAGIIGASNIASFVPLAPDSPQMNGVLSGVPSVPYTIEMRERSNIFSIGLRIYELDRAGADIVNVSIGSTKKSALSSAQYLEFLGDGGLLGGLRFGAVSFLWGKFFDSHPDILFVPAASNYGVDAEDTTPANHGDKSNVLVVGGVNTLATLAAPPGEAIRQGRQDALQSSGFGTKVGIAAPGSDVYAPVPGGGYTSIFDGTSAAAPFVTGVAGLIKAMNPNLTPPEVKQVIIESADPVATGEPDKTLGTDCYDLNNNPNNYTGCLLNALAAVCDFRVLNCDPPKPSVLTVDETTDNSVALSWTQNPDRDFMSYKLFRSDEPNVGIDDTLLAEITEKTTTTFIDTGLQQGQTFFYALLTFDEGGKSSLSNEVEATTGPPPAPERFLIKAGLSSGAPQGEEPPRILVADSADRLWTVYTNKDTSNDYQVFTSFSDDQGQIWTEEQVTSTTRSPSTNVSIATDSTGTVHILWAEHISGSRRGLFHASRTNSAADWTSTKETVFSTNKTINLGGLTVDKNDVLHAVWSVQQSTFTSNLFYSKRISAVSDWTDNLELVDSKPRLFFATAANSVVSDGNSGIHVAYAARGSASDPTKTHVFYTKRVGSSGDWADNREQITGLDAASGLGFDQFFRALLVTDDETPYLIFDGSGFGDFPNRPQVVAARRTLGTWTLMPLTNNFNGGAAPTITRSQDGTFRVFFGSAGTGTHTTKSQLFISEGDGITWSTPVALTDEPLNQTRPNALITPVPASGYGLVFSESVPGGFDLFFLDGGLVF